MALASPALLLQSGPYVKDERNGGRSAAAKLRLPPLAETLLPSHGAGGLGQAPLSPSCCPAYKATLGVLAYSVPLP